MAPDDPTIPPSDDAPPAPVEESGQAPASTDADELRGKDLLSRPRAELEAALDPSTLAQLASWFDRPSAAVVLEQAEADEADLQAQQAQEAHDARARRIAADADPGFLTHVERHNHAFEVLVPQRPPITLHLDERLVPDHVWAAFERLHGDAPPDAREYDPPEDIVAFLARDNAPQAILRDLYRPVEAFERRLVAVFDLEEEAPIFRVGAAMAERTPIEWIRPGSAAFDEVHARFTAIVKEPWEDHHAAVQARLRADREGATS
jgi:hypothetical protein